MSDICTFVRGYHVKIVINSDQNIPLPRSKSSTRRAPVENKKLHEEVAN